MAMRDPHFDPTAWFVKAAGDDGLIIGPERSMQEYSDTFSEVASDLGFKAKTDPGVVTGEGPRPTYCSRHVFAWVENNEVVVRTPRLIGKAMVNFGHTVKTVNYIPAYLRAKALSEMTWASGWPVAQALFIGTLEREDVSSCTTLEVDRDLGYRLLGGEAQGMDFKEMVKAAKAAASAVPTSWVEPTDGARAIFSEMTGVSPALQKSLEHVLRTGARNKRHFSDDEVAGLLRWR